MKLFIKFLVSVLSCFASFTYAEQLTQTQYDDLVSHYMEIIQNTKIILDSEKVTATVVEQNKAFCERIIAYENIRKISEENRQLENASTMLIATNYYLERQNKSLGTNGFSSAVFCKAK